LSRVGLPRASRGAAASSSFIRVASQRSARLSTISLQISKYLAAIEEMDAFVAWLLDPAAVIPRHRVSPSASPMTGSSGVSSTPRLLDSITGVSGILGRPVKPGDDDRECGAS